MIDLHCHILPGLDDGAADLQVSLDMARVAVADGIRSIVATPHVVWDAGGPSPEVIREQVAELQQAITAAGIDLALLPGAEYEAADTLPERAQRGEILTLGDLGQHVLVEMPFIGHTAFIEHVVFGLQLAGFTPVLAHPERCQIARDRAETIQNLCDRGCLVQINAGSLSGRHGRASRAVAERLMQSGMVHVIATDAHDTRRRPPRLSPCLRHLKRFGGAVTLARCTVEVPAAIVADHRVDLRHPAPNPF